MDPWGMPVQQQEAAAKQPQLDPWGGVASAAPTSAAGNGINDPWSPAKEPPRASPNLAAAGPSPNLGGPSPVNQPSKYSDPIFFFMTTRHFKKRVRRASYIIKSSLDFRIRRITFMYVLKLLHEKLIFGVFTKKCANQHLTSKFL